VAQDLVEVVAADQGLAAATDRKRILFKIKGRPGKYAGPSPLKRKNQVFFITQCFYSGILISQIPDFIMGYSERGLLTGQEFT
jgi:hypothetical protein